MAAAFGFAAAGVAAVVALAVASPFTSPEEPSAVAAADASRALLDGALVGVPAPVEPAFVPGRPVPLRDSSHISRWAIVVSPVRPREEPHAAARELPWLSTRTPEGTTNIVLVLDRRLDAAGGLWIRVLLPSLDADATGWVPREALGGYGTVRTRLVVDIESLQATLLRDGRAVFRADVGVGEPAWPTPTGEFYVRNRLTGYASPQYGPIAFGTSARSRVLTDWPAGGFVGIHGTDRPDLLPGYVSHGCIRMRNEDILRLARLMPVGTPLTVR